MLNWNKADYANAPKNLAHFSLLALILDGFEHVACYSYLLWLSLTTTERQKTKEQSWFCYGSPFLAFHVVVVFAVDKFGHGPPASSTYGSSDGSVLFSG